MDMSTETMPCDMRAEIGVIHLEDRDAKACHRIARSEERCKELFFPCSPQRTHLANTLDF